MAVEKFDALEQETASGLALGTDIEHLLLRAFRPSLDLRKAVRDLHLEHGPIAHLCKPLGLRDGPR